MTGKKNSPTAAHAVHKRLPKLVPGACRCRWATLKQGYKYGGLSFQVGVWATGRRPVVIEMRTVRKPKLWPRYVTLSGFELGSGKGLMRWELQLGDIEILYIAGAMNEIVKEMCKIK